MDADLLNQKIQELEEAIATQEAAVESMNAALQASPNPELEALQKEFEAIAADTLNTLRQHLNHLKAKSTENQ